MMRFCAVVFAMLCATSAYAGDLAVTSAYYRDTNASLHLVLSNNGKESISVLSPVVDGYDTASLGREGTRVKSVLWYRCRPNPIAPGGMADVTIVLAQPSSKPITVQLGTSTGDRITRTIQCTPEKLRFQAIRFGPDLRTVDLYVRWTDPSQADSLRSIRMDGMSMARSTTDWPARCMDGFAYTRIKLAAPLVEGSFHTFHVETRSGLSTAYQIRAIPAEFLIGVYGSPSEENIKDWAAHGCNHYLSFGAVSPADIDRMNAQGISVGAKYISQPLVDRTAGKVVPMDEDSFREALQEVATKPNLLYHHLVDEPDVADYYAGHVLGVGGMELVARQEMTEKADPTRYTFVQIDNTFRPQNYRVYGESADVLATHRYSLGSSINSEAGQQTAKKLAFFEDLTDTMTRFRQATEPKPLFMIPQFFDLGPGRAGRPPVADEMRIQCYVMIAGGARGVIHYIHSGSTGGHEGARTKTLWDGMTGLHAELKRVGEVASIGTPAPAGWCTSNTLHVVSSLILGGDRMAVVLINRNHRSALAQFTARPVENVKVSIRIPPWTKSKDFRVTSADSGMEIPARVDDGVLSFTVPEVRVASGLLVDPKE